MVVLSRCRCISGCGVVDCDENQQPYPPSADELAQMTARRGVGEVVNEVFTWHHAHAGDNASCCVGSILHLAGIVPDVVLLQFRCGCGCVPATPGVRVTLKGVSLPD